MEVADKHVYEAELGPESDLETFFRSSMLVTQTEFFRNMSLYEELEDIVLPSVYNRRKGKTRKLVLWSAGCSDGREPYSLSMVIKNWIRKEKPAIDIHIHASDINRDQVKAAAARKYTVRPIELERLKQYGEYYVQLDQRTLLVDQSLSQMISFYMEDLTAKKLGALYDIIVCTNVLLYYDRAYRRDIFQSLSKFLREGGYFYVETIGGRYMKHNGYINIKPGSHYYQKISNVNSNN